MTREKFAGQLGVSAMTVWRWIDSGELPVVVLSGKPGDKNAIVRVHPYDADAFIAKRAA